MYSQLSRVLIFLPLAIFASVILSCCASAQCAFLSQQFQNIALEPSNAFLGDYSTNFSSPLSPTAAAFSHGGLRSVARDSEGRVRIVRTAGKFIVKETGGVATEVERLNITICDPTTRTITVLDTAAKSAAITVFSGGLPRIVKPASGQEESFCMALFARRERMPRTQTEDLGHQTISGFDAVGIRIHFTPFSADSGGPVSSTYSELWCSDAIGAILQQTQESKSQTGREFKSEVTMQNIERREPEPALFQIPADYTILEPDTSAERRPLARPIPAPPNSKPQ